jgi:hypothetical protein
VRLRARTGPRTVAGLPGRIVGSDDQPLVTCAVFPSDPDGNEVIQLGVIAVERRGP